MLNKQVFRVVLKDSFSTYDKLLSKVRMTSLMDRRTQVMLILVCIKVFIPYMTPVYLCVTMSALFNLSYCNYSVRGNNNLATVFLNHTFR